MAAVLSLMVTQMRSYMQKYKENCCEDLMENMCCCKIRSTQPKRYFYELPNMDPRFPLTYQGMRVAHQNQANNASSIVVCENTSLLPKHGTTAKNYEAKRYTIFRISI